MTQHDAQGSAIVLAGGGARAAYQVGVLRAIAELLPPHSPSPFRIVCGTSAGAINAAAVAAWARDFGHAVTELDTVWGQLAVRDVYRTDALELVRRFGQWFLPFLFRGGRRRALALLDNAPLRSLLGRRIDLGAVRVAVAEGYLDALTVTASDYRTRMSVSFCAVREGTPLWKRSQRVGVAANIGPEHLLASTAIPFVFEPVQIGGDYFGDGALLQLAPTAPALHLGASRILVIGTTSPREAMQEATGPSMLPSPAEIASHALDSMFADALGTDLEKVLLVNEAARRIPPADLPKLAFPMREVDTMVIMPSAPFGPLAHAHLSELPRVLRLLLGGSGMGEPTGEGLLSYLLFASGYCRALIDLGYHDGRARQNELAAHLRVDGGGSDSAGSVASTARATARSGAGWGPTSA